MTNTTINNNETINNTNKKENKTMKKDYTLNGTINATTWQEFRTVMKEAGINTATKSFDELVEEYNNLSKDNIVSVGDMSSDRYSEIAEERPETETTNDSSKESVNPNKPEVIETLPDIILNKLLGELHSRRGKFDERGLIQVSDAYKAVCKTYERPTENFIKGIINYMVTNKYIRFTKVNGQLQLFLTFKDVVRDDSGRVIGVKNF